MTGLQNSTLHGYSDSDPMVDAHGLDNGVDVDDVPSEVHDIHLEVCLKASSNANPGDIKKAILSSMHGVNIWLTDTDHKLWQELSKNSAIVTHVRSVHIPDLSSELASHQAVLMDFQYQPHVYVYQLYEDGGEDDDEGEDGAVSYKEWQLPATDFEGSWDALYYESSIKRHLLQYASSALLFSDRGVNSQLISWNRVVLLHGPPGTGKTSLCKALAHKLSIRFSDRYTSSQLVEVNAHSLFSKWFSESGKLVSKLFASITELLEEPQALVFVLIDEVESLTAARKAAASGGEPSDAIRAVNALLTQLDALRRFPNVMVLTTSNITEAIDVAFVDRADIKAYLGPPSAAARYEILRSGVLELARAGIISGLRPEHLLSYKELLLLPSSRQHQSDGVLLAASSTGHSNGAATREQQALWTAEALSRALEEVVAGSEGFSGRALRKLPFLAHATADSLPYPCSGVHFFKALKRAAEREKADRSGLTSG